MKKIVIRILLAFCGLVLVAAVILYFSINGMARSQIESTAQHALVQETTLGSADLGIFSGNLTLVNFNVHNPPDFAGPTFLTLDKCAMNLRPTTLLSPTVRLNTITLDGLHLVLEQDEHQNNLQEIIADIQKQRAADVDHSPAQDLDIGTVRLINTRLTIQLEPAGGKPPAVKTYQLAEIVIDHPTKADGQLMKFSDLATEILKRIAAQAANDPQVDPAIRSALATTTAAMDNNLGGTLRGIFHGLGAR